VYDAVVGICFGGYVLPRLHGDGQVSAHQIAKGIGPSSHHTLGTVLAAVVLLVVLQTVGLV